MNELTASSIKDEMITCYIQKVNFTVISCLAEALFLVSGGWLHQNLLLLSKYDSNMSTTSSQLMGRGLIEYHCLTLHLGGVGANSSSRHGNHDPGCTSGSSPPAGLEAYCFWPSGAPTLWVWGLPPWLSTTITWGVHMVVPGAGGLWSFVLYRSCGRLWWSGLLHTFCWVWCSIVAVPPVRLSTPFCDKQICLTGQDIRISVLHVILLDGPFLKKSHLNVWYWSSCINT